MQAQSGLDDTFRLILLLKVIYNELMVMQQEKPAVLFVVEVAERLRMHPNTLRRKVKSGLFPIRPITGIDSRLRFSEAEVEKLERRTR